jgi:hypothetical protein
MMRTKTWLTGRLMAVLLMHQMPLLDLKSIDNSFNAVHIHNRVPVTAVIGQF